MSWNWRRKPLSELPKPVTPAKPRGAAIAAVSAPGQAPDHSAKVRMWRRRALLRKGAGLHVASVGRNDDFSLAVLDPAGIVVCWYGRRGEKETEHSPVIGRHVSQFYLARDVATDVPRRDLSAATTLGRSTREGWRLQADRQAFWAVTNIETLSRRDGRLQGFVHVIRPGRDPAQRVPVARPRPARQRGAGFAVGVSTPAFAR